MFSPRLSMTPSVALRALYEQMLSFDVLNAENKPVGLYTHFVGPITPPAINTRRAIGDPVFDAIAAYASKIVARSGLLTSSSKADEQQRLNEYGRLTRMLFATEHALAIDLGRVTPEITLRHREVSARSVLAVAALWCDRDRILDPTAPENNPLLGSRPGDENGTILWTHANTSLTPGRKRSEGGGLAGNDNIIGIDIGLSSSVA